MERILIIRLKSIGDVAFTLPAVNAIRANFPSAKITFLTSKENAVLLRGFSAVDTVIALDRAAMRTANPLKVIPMLFTLFRQLQDGCFDLVIDFQGYGETAWLARLTGAPQRWGSIYGKGRAWAYTRGVTRQEKLHPVDWNFSLLQQCGLQTSAVQNEFRVPDDAMAAAEKIFEGQQLKRGEPVLFIQPFTSSPQKNWPLENYLAAARHWRDRGVQILFGGGPGDRTALAVATAAGFRVCTDAPLLVSVGLAKLSTFMLGGDTGLGHLAVAAGRRVSMVMMGNTPGFCIPYGHVDWTIVPEPGGNIASIPINAVLTATEQAFHESASMPAA